MAGAWVRIKQQRKNNVLIWPINKIPVVGVLKFINCVSVVFGRIKGGISFCKWVVGWGCLGFIFLMFAI